MVLTCRNSILSKPYVKRPKRTHETCCNVEKPGVKLCKFSEEITIPRLIIGKMPGGQSIEKNIFTIMMKFLLKF